MSGTEAFTKVILPGGWDFDGPGSQLVKVSSWGLRGNDFRNFVKRAGHQFADQLRRLDLKPGDVPCHDIIVGATEYFGPNRNGDGFKEACCRKHHHTFVKFARCYRDHQNKDPQKSYGLVKHSAYNERMKRVELLSVYNGTKEAADRNGGLVADIEIEKLAAGRDLPISMACTVPYDVCSCCGNKARHRGEYCLGRDEGGHCEAGGLRHKIAAVTGDDDNPILHADNPDPRWFDKSLVTRGADRIAFAMSLQKSARAAGRSGAELAEAWGVTAPDILEADGDSAELYKLACRLADLEADFAARGVPGRQVLAFDAEAQPAANWTSSGGRLGEMLQALALYKVAMPVEGFLAVTGQGDFALAPVAERVREHLPGVYGRLVKSGELASLLAGNPFVPATRLSPLAVRRWAEKRAGDYSLGATAVAARASLAAVRGASPHPRREALIKSADAGSRAAAAVAAHYALYKLAALKAMADAHPAEAPALLTAGLAQNYA